MRIYVAAIMTACSIAFASIGAVPVMAANSSAKLPAYSFTFQLPADLKHAVTLSLDMVTVQNPHPSVLLQQHRYSAVSYLEDRHGSVLPDDSFIASKSGFLLELYHFIAILPPVYQEGYTPVAFDKKMSEMEPGSLAWAKLRGQRGEKYVQARIQALINAGYVLPEELDSGPVTKEFVARILYRLFKDVRPYQGSVAPVDSADAAVRWAIELGIPGYEPDQQGKVYPQLGFRQNREGDKGTEILAYRELFDFLSMYLPGKKTDTGWEYYQLQLKPNAATIVCADCLIRVNGKPLQQVLENNPDLYKNEAFMDSWQKTAMQISEQAVQQFAGILERKRQDGQKPRVLDWRKDVLQNQELRQPIAQYRLTKSREALEAVYREISSRYHLFPRQDSIDVIKSVLDSLH